MKLSAVVLLSVNLVAASQLAAHASDTASFLQDTLSSTPPAASNTGGAAARPPAKPARAAQSKKRAAGKSYIAMTPVIDGVKVRQFVPGRYLPSAAELQAKKQSEQQAQVAAYAQPGNEQGVLSGQVSSNHFSELGAILAPAASYAMSRPSSQDCIQKAIQKVKQVAKNYSAGRTIPGMKPVLPGQLAKLPGGPSALPDIPEPEESSLPQVPQPPTRQGAPLQLPQAPTSNVAAPSTIVPPPALTSYEDRQLIKLVESNMPENVYAGFNGDMRSGQGNPGLAGAGPPPFPLSTNPLNHARGVRTTIGQQARFGSWHGGNSNLPQGSFHSYVPVHMAGHMAVNIHHYSASKKTGRQAHSISAQPTHSAPALAKKAEAVKKPHEVPVAKYPPYQRYSQFL